MRPSDLLEFRHTTYHFRFHIRGFGPEIWRGIEFPDCRLDTFHAVLLASFGWSDRHTLRCTSASAYHPTYGFPGSGKWERKWLSDLVPRDGLPISLRYEVDEREPWTVGARFYGCGLSELRQTDPFCVAGERAGIPDDDLRPSEFRDLLARLDEQARSLRRRRASGAVEQTPPWNAWGYDPRAFDCDAMNAALRPFCPPRRDIERLLFIPMNPAEQVNFFRHATSSTCRLEAVRAFASTAGIYAYLPEATRAARNLLITATLAGPGELQWRLEHLAGKLYRAALEHRRPLRAAGAELGVVVIACMDQPSPPA